MTSTSTQLPAPLRASPAADPIPELVELLTDKLIEKDRRAIERILGDHPQYAERLQALLPALEVVNESGPAAAGSETPTADADNRGKLGVALLGDFRIIREIGRGGMGVVYEAEQVSLGRRVALKVLPLTGVLDGRQLERFKNEARAAASLHHPHIVPVYAVGCERGVHYYAMQYVDGRTLAQVIEHQASGERKSRADVNGTQLSFASDGDGSRSSSDDRRTIGGDGDCKPKIESSQLRIDGGAGPSTLGYFESSTSAVALSSSARFRTIAEWGIQIAEALDYAHSVGVIHRDIKPANLMLDGQGKAWITDFGLARLEADAGLTMTGDILGTLRYSSPEQALGARGLVDQRTDVYSLGATLYELFTGRPIFSEKDRAVLLQHVAHDDPIVPRRIQPALPIELETIVLKALEKDPALRYTTARDLADDLRRFLMEQPIKARPATRLDRARKWARRNRQVVRTAISFVGLTAIAFVAAAVWVDHARHETRLEQQARASEQIFSAAAKHELSINRYVASINLANKAWREGDFKSARDHLGKWVPGKRDVDLRGFEWHLLWNATQGVSPTFGNHQGSAYCAAVSRDGSTLVTGGQDGIRVWDLASGAPGRHLMEHAAEVNGVGFSPAGELLATASEDRTVKIWNAATWEVEHTLPHTGEVVAAVFSPDGRLLITGERLEGPDRDGRSSTWGIVRRWDTQTWRPGDAPRRLASAIQSLAISSDGALYATGIDDGTTCLWDLQTGEPVRTIPTASTRCVAFAHRHPWLATAGYNGPAQVWNIADGKLVTTLPEPAQGLECVTFSPDDSFLATGGYGERGHLWRMTSDGTYTLHEPLRCDSRLWSALFTSGDSLISTSNAGTVKRWTFGDGRHRRRLDTWKNPDFAFLPRGEGIVVTSRSSVDLVSLDGSWKQTSLSGEWGSRWGLDWRQDGRWNTASLAVSPDGRQLLALYHHGSAELRDLSSNAVIWRTQFDAVARREVDFTTVGTRTLVTYATKHAMGGFGGELPTDYYDAATGNPIPLPAPISESRDRARFSAVGRTCVVIRPNHQLEVWRDDYRLWLIPPSGPIWGTCALTSNGERVAACRADGTIHVWDVRDIESEYEFVGDTNPIEQLAFAPDGRTLAGTTTTGAIRFWNVHTGRELLTLDAGLHNVKKFGFSPTGNAFAVWGQNPAQTDCEIVIWLAGHRSVSAL